MGQVVGNTATDGASNRKYYYFIRWVVSFTLGHHSLLMSTLGRLNSGGHMTSHVVQEVALQTQPTVVRMPEEVRLCPDDHPKDRLC